MKIKYLLQHLYSGECETGSVPFLRPYIGLEYVRKWSLRGKKKEEEEEEKKYKASLGSI